MLNNETWLVHSDLFTKYWIIETKSWVRDLGWFTELQKLSNEAGGWLLMGEQSLTTLDYVNLVDAVGSEKKMYGYNNGAWDYFDSPVLFVVKKNEHEVYIAGWGGDKKTIDKNKNEYDSPWDWKNIKTIEVNPLIAISSAGETKTNIQNKKFSVFFTSNGETNADHNWERLRSVCPRALRIDGIDGRRNVFLKCAELAGEETHFFVVTGKNFITDASVFEYVPDNTVPKAHIIFQAKNMSNRLEYGHMGVGLYNKDLVLDTPENFGLDFTEWGKVYPVPKTVSEAYFATSPYEAWRTAFRETLKLTLKYTESSQQWLNRWIAFAEGPNAEWVLAGAQHGKQYALEHKDDEDALRKTVDWQWLEEYFNTNGQLYKI